MVTKKEEFNRPSDMTHDKPHESVDPAIAPAGSPLAGTWVNVDSATRSLVRIVIASSGANLTVHPFGACSPTPCDWGALAGHTYAANVSSPAVVAFTATSTTTFSQTILAAHLNNGLLTVDLFTRFTDGSSRFDYTARDVFHRG